MQRFSKLELCRTNLQRIVSPSDCIIVTNLPAGRSAEEVRTVLAEKMLVIKDMFTIKSTRTAKGQNRAILYIAFESVYDGTMAMALLATEMATAEIPEGLKTAFSQKSFDEEKQHAETGKKGYKLIPNDEQLD